jgi:hypothetical protein
VFARGRDLAIPDEQQINAIALEQLLSVLVVRATETVPNAPGDGGPEPAHRTDVLQLKKLGHPIGNEKVMHRSVKNVSSPLQ